MEVIPSEPPTLVLVRTTRREHPRRPELLEPKRAAAGPVITEADRAEVFAAELRLTIVRRACGWRLGPPSILSAVAQVLGKLAATAARGDRDRLAPLIDDLHRQMDVAAAAALGPEEGL